MSGEDAWWYESSGQRLGPVPLAELQAMAAKGALTPQTRVWKKGTADWVVAASIAALFPPAAGGKPDLGMRMLLPVGRSGWAIAAGYCGLFAFIPIVGILAMVFSTVAIFDLKKHPDKTGWGRIITGYVLGVLFTVIYAIAVIAH